jgi:hypothetical protein
MRKTILIISGYAAFVLLALLCLEGALSIARWKHADRSIVYDGYQLINRSLAAPSPSNHPLAGRDEIESLIPTMIQAGLGMGNTPYNELVTDQAAINEVGPDGCQSPKANLRKTTTYIRTVDYDLFDPPSLFFDRGVNLGNLLSQFVRKYSINMSDFSTNNDRERITFPILISQRKVLVAGDSVAVGAMIGDIDTISSQMQSRDVNSQYINLGVNGAPAEQIICRLKSAGIRYNQNIVHIIYIYSENDFDAQKPYGKPVEVIAWLKTFATDQNKAKVTIVFAPYIYNIIPNLTRFPGSRGAEHKTFAAESDALKQETLKAGFDYVSIGEMASKEAVSQQTDFAAFGLFVDHAHLSKYGVSKLVDKLLE